MTDSYVPLIDWYPTLYGKWVREGRRLPVPVESRTGYTIHHTAGGVGEPPLSYARFVGSWHYSRWSRPGGYNFLIGSDGVVLEMCGWGHVGAHAPGANRSTIGVAFQGTFDSMMPSSRQRSGFARLVAGGPVPNRQQGHRDASSTSCPGDRLYRALPLPVDAAKDDDMNAAQERKLDGLIQTVERALDRERRPSLWRDVDQIKQAVGRLDGAIPDLAGKVAVEVAAQLPAGTVDVDVLASKVADVIFSRVGDA